MNSIDLPRSLRLTLLLGLLVAQLAPSCPALIPSTGLHADARQAVSAEAKETPFLASFISLVTNGHADQITGIYSSGIFADPVVQQPSGNSGYISSAPDTVTQFQSASYYGSLGFLAHNSQAGKLFSRFGEGEAIVLVQGDGSYRTYRVAQVLHFQATNPGSQYSDFIDLENGNRLTYNDLFFQTYGVSGRVVLQTCIDANGNGSWGRLFIIALPMRQRMLSIFLKARPE
jgi:hypothetical protein